MQEPIKDEDRVHPVASTWRPTLREIVKAFTKRDYGLAEGVRQVAPVAASTECQIREYIEDYGETLVDLPDETWATSVAQWMGSSWELVIDLWTLESGQSDMVLSTRVFEIDDSLRIEIDSVHVP